MNHDQNTFFLNTKKMPSTMNPYLALRSAIARAYGTDDDCVHLEIASVADDGGEYTNHAIIIRGWGEEHGNGGTSFVARIVDYAGLEHQGVDVRVDGERGMMASLLEQYKEKYPHIKYVDLVPG